MKHFSFVFSVACLMASMSVAQEAADSVAPEGASALGGQIPEALLAAQQAKEAGQPTSAENWMVAAANPLAVEAGADVLRAGGSAADAMVAVQSVLGLVEPQSSGLGGGAFLVYYDATNQDRQEKNSIARLIEKQPKRSTG